MPLAVIAYCFMPEHVHLLVLATSETSDLRAFVHSVKQRTAYYYKQSHAATLWQEGYYEHVLRDDEATLATAKYILENPVRAGLVAEPRDHAFAGSLVLDAEQLDDLWQCDAESLRDVGFRSNTGTP
jgi:putative transposase